MVINNPPPDFSAWVSDMLNLNGNRVRCESKPDDEAILQFYDSESIAEYDAKGLLHILKNKLPPLDDEGLKQLAKYMNSTRKVHGNNRTANSFSSCVNIVAKFVIFWDDKLRVCIKYLEKRMETPLSPNKDAKVVSNVREHLAKAFKDFPYSPDNPYVSTEDRIEKLVHNLFGTQICALFMKAETEYLDRDTLLHQLAQIFTGTKPYHDAEDFTKSYSLTLFPHNYIFYEMVLVMCGTMITRFVDANYLKWSIQFQKNVLKVSHRYSGKEGLITFVSQLEGTQVASHPPPIPIPSIVKNSKDGPPASRTRFSTNSTTPILKKYYESEEDDNDNLKVGEDRNVKESTHVEDDVYESEEDDNDDRSVVDDDVKVGADGNEKEDDLKEIDDVTQHDGNMGGSDWNDSLYADDSLWDNKNFNHVLGEWRGKSKWTTPAACMDTTQRTTLEGRISTLSQAFARFSQRPGKDWPEQEWALVQLTDINGIGDKNPKNRRTKTAVNAYGRPEAIIKYNKWLTDTKEGGEQFVNRTASTLKDLKVLWKSREENESTPSESTLEVENAAGLIFTGSTSVVRQDLEKKPSGDSTEEELESSFDYVVEKENDEVEGNEPVPTPTTPDSKKKENGSDAKPTLSKPTGSTSVVRKDSEKKVTNSELFHHHALAPFSLNYPEIFTQDFLKNIPGIRKPSPSIQNEGVEQNTACSNNHLDYDDDSARGIESINKAADKLLHPKNEQIHSNDNSRLTKCQQKNRKRRSPGPDGRKKNNKRTSPKNKRNRKSKRKRKEQEPLIKDNVTSSPKSASTVEELRDPNPSFDMDAGDTFCLLAATTSSSSSTDSSSKSSSSSDSSTTSNSSTSSSTDSSSSSVVNK